MKRFAVGYSDLDNSKEALSIVCEQISSGMGRKEPILVVFCSDSENFAYYSKQLRRRFPFSTVMGMTAYMGFSSRGYGKNALSCLAIMDGIEIKAGKMISPKGGFKEFASKVIDTMNTLKETENTLCFSCGAKMLDMETALETGQVLEEKGIKVCGGSIGEDDNLSTMLSFNGEVFDQGGMFCFIHNLCGRIELFSQSMSEDGIENILEKTADTVKGSGIKPVFSIVANGIDYTLAMEKMNLLYDFTDMFCMEFGEYMGFSGYKDKDFYKSSYDSMLIAMFE